PPRLAIMKLVCAEHQDDDCAGRVQNILAQDPVNYDALVLDGALSLAKGDASKSLRIFEYLSSTYTRNPQVRYQLALAYLLSAKSTNDVSSRKAVENAERSLNDAIKLDPSFQSAVRLFTELKRGKGNPAAAIEPLVRLIDERPQNA